MSTDVEIFKNYPDLVNLVMMIDMLSISRSTAYKLLQDNTIKHCRIGNSYRIPKKNIIEYLFETCS